MVDGGMNLDSGSNGSQVNNVGVDFVQQVSSQTSASAPATAATPAPPLTRSPGAAATATRVT